MRDINVSITARFAPTTNALVPSLVIVFVKGKVAVYVEDPATADTSKDAKLKDEGWVVLRYDINSITDGLDQGAEIAAAVKANIRAQKAAKKKKKPAKK